MKLSYYACIEIKGKGKLMKKSILALLLLSCVNIFSMSWLGFGKKKTGYKKAETERLHLFNQEEGSQDGSSTFREREQIIDPTQLSKKELEEEKYIQLQRMANALERIANANQKNGQASHGPILAAQSDMDGL